MRETKESKTGIVLAMMYAITMIPKVQLSQQTQWVIVLLFRWREPRRRWTKMYFAGICRAEVVSRIFLSATLHNLHVKQ